MYILTRPYIRSCTNSLYAQRVHQCQRCNQDSWVLKALETFHCKDRRSFFIFFLLLVSLI